MGKKEGKKVGKNLMNALHSVEGAEVTFTKVNGDLRVMRCTLEEDFLNSVAGGGAEEATRVSSDKVTCVWDIEAEGWRSFRNESLISWRTL